MIRARDVVFTIEGSAKTPFLSGLPIDWRRATTMSVQTTFFSALEERQRPDKGGVAMIKGCTHIYAPKRQTGEYATLAANHRGNGARPVPVASEGYRLGIGPAPAYPYVEPFVENHVGKAEQDSGAHHGSPVSKAAVVRGSPAVADNLRVVIRSRN